MSRSDVWWLMALVALVGATFAGLVLWQQAEEGRLVRPAREVPTAYDRPAETEG